MKHLSRKHALIAAACVALTGLGACAGGAAHEVPAHLAVSPLDRHEIKVVKRTRFLEVDIDSRASELSQADRSRIRTFIAGYSRAGHGPLIVSLPQVSSNPQLALTAVAEARLIAWQNGVEYEEIKSEVHGGGSPVSEPMILAYQAYDAIPPGCPPVYRFDLGDTAMNETMPFLGCSVRTNLAEMIVDPADLLGRRALEGADLMRREVILEKFRLGEMTASERNEQESGAVSTAVN